MQENPIREAFAAAIPVDMDEAEAAPRADDAPEDAAPAGMEPPPVLPEDAPEAEAATFPLNDYGNGQRMAHYYGRDTLFVPRLGWCRWDGRRWASDEDQILVRRDAQKIAARIMHEIPFIALEDWQRATLERWHQVRNDYTELKDKKSTELTETDAARLSDLEQMRRDAAKVQDILDRAKAAHRAHAKTSGNSGRISNMMLEAQPALAVTVDELNADPMQLCCENGVLHFTWAEDAHDKAWGGSGRVPQVDLLPHVREQRITKMARAHYRPDAACPEWDRFLARVQPAPEVRAFLKRWFGYSLTGSTTEQKLAFLYGHGRNGKSTLVDVLARIMDDYSSTIPIETLTGTEQRKGSEATPDLVRLPGARFVRASEPEQGQKMKEALIKALTGGEPILIRRMMQEFVEITPAFKLTISGNYKPEIRGADDGIWRRVMLVPFLEQIPADEVDPALPAKLWAERDGILRWMVEGCLEWMDKGLQPPAVVTEATAAYRLDSDPLRMFLESECDITGSPEHFETARDLGDAFNAWLLDSGTSAWGMRQTANGIKRRAENVTGAGGEVFRAAKRSTTGYLGIRLHDAARDRVAAFRDRLGGGGGGGA